MAKATTKKQQPPKRGLCWICGCLAVGPVVDTTRGPAHEVCAYATHTSEGATSNAQ